MRTDILRVAKVRLALCTLVAVSVVERVHVILLVGAYRRGEGSRVVDVVFSPSLLFVFVVVGHLSAPFTNGEFLGEFVKREREGSVSLSVRRSLARNAESR
jgi:hypothetical protein